MEVDQQSIAEKGEDFIWGILKGGLERQGEVDAIFYLSYLISIKVYKIETAGKFKKVRFKSYQRLSDYTTRYNAFTGEQISWFFSVLMEKSERSLDNETCLRAAREVATPPADAVLETSAYEEYAGMPVFVVRWVHRHNSIPVERDFIQVLVNGQTGRPFSFYIKWHRVDETPSYR